MVVPLKLTQFYGHSVPRPRIYADVKFSDQRVDPPPSVNDALLSWASEAHWSMGGLSFKTLRSQGKVEGSVRRLRAFEEDAEAPDASENSNATKKEIASKPAETAAKGKPSVDEVSGRPIQKKSRRSEEEFVEATPARKLGKRDAAGIAEEGSPAFVPATQEKVQIKVAESGELPSVRKKALKPLAKAEAIVEYTPKSVAVTRERRREKLTNSSAKALRGSKSPADNGDSSPECTPVSEGRRSTRSEIKKADAPVQLSQSTKGRPRARKILVRGTLASDDDSSESDDGLEAFLREKRRTPRRSSRHGMEQGKPLQTSLELDSE